MALKKEEAGKLLMKALREKLSVSSHEKTQHFDEVCSADFWRGLNPQLNIGADEPAENFEADPLNEAEIARTLKKLSNDGYFAMPRPIVRPEIAKKMLKGVENLRKAGWHELWALVYDEFWRATRTPSTVRFLRQALGENYTALPHAVIHYVRPETGAGWSPHIDFSDRDHRFTVWFSVGEATTENGCMHVITKRRVEPELLEKWRNTQDLSHAEIKRLMQGTHALPVPPGSILGWEGDVIHWGGMSHGKTEPRISISVVLLPANIPAMKDELPLLSPVDLPSFGQRLQCIAKAINLYKIHVLDLNQYAELSTKIFAKYQADTEKTPEAI